MPRTRPPDIQSGLPDTPGDAARITDGVRRGDRAAFSLLYERFAGRVFEAAKMLTGRDEQFCLDVVQETMMRAIRSLPRLDDDASLNSWLVTTARRVAIDLLRQEWRRTARERTRHQPRSEPSHAMPALHAPEERQWLRDQLRSLDSETENWVRLHLGEGKTLRDLAEIGSLPGDASVGLSRDAIHGRIRRALGALRLAAKERFGHE